MARRLSGIRRCTSSYLPKVARGTLVQARLVVADEAPDHAGQAFDRDLAIGADVEHLAVRLGHVDRAHEPLHHVRDVGEAARLLAGAVELEGLALEGGPDEDGLRPAPPRDVLPRAVAAEEAEDHALQPVPLAEGQERLLLEHLRDRVAPPADVGPADDGDALLRERDVGVPPVAVRGRGQHHPPHAVIAARAQHAQPALAVDRRGCRGRRRSAGSCPRPGGRGRPPPSRSRPGRPPRGWCRDGSGSAGGRRGSARLSSDPWERSSRPATSSPRAISLSARFEPMKPATPVTATFRRTSCRGLRGLAKERDYSRTASARVLRCGAVVAAALAAGFCYSPSAPAAAPRGSYLVAGGRRQRAVGKC